MNNITPASFRRLLEAVEIIHTHEKETFPQRLFRALRLLFRDSMFSFELFGRDGSSVQHTDVPCEERRLNEIMTRVAELAPHEHPAFPHLIRGEQAPLLLSELTSTQVLRRTGLYNEAYKPLDIKFQLILPLATASHAGGVTISRGTSDYSEEDKALSKPLARHVILAFDADRRLTQKSPSPPKPASGSKQNCGSADSLSDLGLSKRECEVLWWIGQGKQDREISLILGLSLRTVHHHTSAVLKKLQVESRTAAVCLLHKRNRSR